MKVRITSDGMARGTRVENADTGEQIDGVAFVGWRVDAAGGVAAVNLEISAPAVDVIGEWTPDAITDGMIAAAAWAIGQVSPVQLHTDEMKAMAEAALNEAHTPGHALMTTPPARVSREERGGDPIRDTADTRSST